jgi:hypothetical protein
LSFNHTTANVELVAAYPTTFLKEFSSKVAIINPYVNIFFENDFPLCVQVEAGTHTTLEMFISPSVAADA